MDHEAYHVLEALGRGAHAELAGRERWVEAFKTIRWAVEGVAGPMLTAEGRQARDQLAGERGQSGAAQTPRQRQAARRRGSSSS
jgi:hypothetical protein